jgi:hypothetical protein
MGQSRESALRELGLLVESAQALRNELRTKERVYRKMAKILEQGEPVASMMSMVNAATARHDMTRSLDEFERVRHQVRLALTAAGLEEGMTIGDLGRALGFSRQLAARYAHEARQTHPVPEVGEGA